MNICQIPPEVVFTLTDQYDGHCYGTEHFSSKYEYELLMSYWEDKVKIIDMFISGKPQKEFCEYSFILLELDTGKTFLTKCERSCSYTHYSTRFPDNYFIIEPVAIKEKVVKYWDAEEKEKVNV